VATRLCNKDGKLVASGTYVTKPYAARGSASARPRGVSVSKLDLARPTADSDGSATALLKLRRGARYPARSHAVHIVLTDADSGDVVPITYRKDTTVTKDARGNIASVKLAIPAGTTMPASVRAYVVSDVYPLLARVFG
jgi:hypothetical protein